VASASTDPVVVMGVSGCGKSRIGTLLAEALGATFLEGDAFHPAENVARMRAGIALTDADREPWLRCLSDTLARERAAGRGAVLACSALKRRYRDVLRQGAPDLKLVFLRGARELLAARLAARQHAYMPASLLDSQLAALEAPQADERAVVCDIASSPEAIVAHVMQQLGSPDG
jgi:gluconokinase